MRQLIVGSRDSRLALAQAEQVINELKQAAPGLSCEIKTIKTKGDKILDTALAKIGDKGLFVKEIENALLQGEIDLAVHSMKDLPTAIPAGLAIGAVAGREDPRDALVSFKPVQLDGLPAGTAVGTGSLRRIAQLACRYPGLDFKPVRGNLETRLRKLEEGEFAALVLALAGLKRMGRPELVAEVIAPGICLPAVGQGALAVEIRDGDAAVAELVSRLDRPHERAAVTAERAFLRRLEGGCQVPLGALGEVAGGNLRLRGVIASLDGSAVLRDETAGPVEAAEEIGVRLAEKLLGRGAAAILEQVRLASNAE